MLTCRKLTPIVPTKLLLSRPWHRVTYTYARELPGASSPYRVRCSCGHDFGWLRATLRAILPLAELHASGEDITSATQRHAHPVSALRPHLPTSNALAARSGGNAGTHFASTPRETLPPCSLDASSPYADALAWVTGGD